MSEGPKVRALLGEAIQSTVSVDEDLPEGAMLLGWIAIAEWMAPDGKRWLSRVDGNSNGEGCPPWQCEGYLHNALFDSSGFIPDSDDE